jgi:hypothetical protein
VVGYISQLREEVIVRQRSEASSSEFISVDDELQKKCKLLRFEK